MADPALSQLIDRIQTARSQKATLDIRGGGTKAFYGEAPQGEPLDLTPLRGISCYEPTELVVTVRAGTPLAELEAALAERGQCLPFEPPRFAPRGMSAGAVPPGGMSAGAVPPGGMSAETVSPGGTVGGMVAAGLSGPARATVGCVRDYVLGVTMVNGRGEVLSFGGQVMKNVAGYDLARVLPGSMGILGVIAEVSLKVLPVPVATRTLRFELDAAAALRQLNAWGGQPLPLSASAWWDGTLVLRLAGAAAAVESAAQRLGGETIPAELAATFWTGLRDHTDEYFAGALKAVAGGARLWRLSVPQVAPPLALAGEQLVEWGGAQRWLCSTLPVAQVREAARAAGGHAVLFRANDKSAGVLTPLSAPLMRIQRALKQSFDPDGVFNRGRLYPDL